MPSDIEFRIPGDGNCAFNSLAIGIMNVCLNPDGGLIPPLQGPIYQLDPNSFEYQNYLWMLDIVRENNPSLRLSSQGTLQERLIEFFSHCNTDDCEFDFIKIQKILANAQREMLKVTLNSDHSIKKAHFDKTTLQMTEMLHLYQTSQHLARLAEPFDTCLPLQDKLTTLKANPQSRQAILDWCQNEGYQLHCQYTSPTGVGGITEMGVEAGPPEIAVISELLGLDTEFQFKTAQTRGHGAVPRKIDHQSQRLFPVRIGLVA